MSVLPCDRKRKGQALSYRQPGANRTNNACPFLLFLIALSLGDRESAKKRKKRGQVQFVTVGSDKLDPSPFPT